MRSIVHLMATREVTLNETIHSLEVLNEQLSSEIISLRNSLPKQVVEMEVDEKDTSNETLHDDSNLEIAGRTIQSNQDPRLEEGNRYERSSFFLLTLTSYIWADSLRI